MYSFHWKLIGDPALLLYSTHFTQPSLTKMKTLNGQRLANTSKIFFCYLILERIPSANGKDLLIRQNIGIIMKVFIVCILLAPMICYIIFFIHEITHLVSFWTQQLLTQSHALTSWNTEFWGRENCIYRCGQNLPAQPSGTRKIHVLRCARVLKSPCCAASISQTPSCAGTVLLLEETLLLLPSRAD